MADEVRVGSVPARQVILGAVIVVTLLVVGYISLTPEGRMGADDYTIGLMLTGNYPVKADCLFISSVMSSLVRALNWIGSVPIVGVTIQAARAAEGRPRRLNHP